MNNYEYIKKCQAEWALNQGIELCGSDGDRGSRTYCPSVDSNLFEPLSDLARNQIEAGDGGELKSKGTQRARMQAVHSSSVLPVNVFHYWQSNGQLDPIASACGFCNPGKCPSSELQFEKKFPIFDDAPKHPNLDVTFVNKPDSKYRFFAVESKFTEPYGRRVHGGMKKVYLKDTTIWKGLPNLRRLAEKISPDDTLFETLHAAQLIKHILGLSKASGGKSRFRLLYLWYDAHGKAGVGHREEIDRFSETAKKDGVSFLAMTYQGVILKLADKQRKSHPEYIRYVSRRYL